jgi:hypothetical protein
LEKREEFSRQKRSNLEELAESNEFNRIGELKLIEGIERFFLIVEGVVE